MLNRFPFLPPESSRPGVELTEADFTAFGTGRVPFAGGRFVVKPAATSRPDTHDVSECWMIVAGSGLLNYNGVDTRVAAGDFVFFEPRQTHYIHNDGDQTLTIYTVWWLEAA